MAELNTIEFIKAHRDDWKEILTKIPYCLSIKEDEHFALLKYNQVESDFNEAIVKECRGLIIDLHTIEPVALSFKKFHNVQEPLADTIYWKDCKVQEKIDGSKMLVWFNKYKDKWQISTSSSLDAYNAPVNDFGMTFGKLFEIAQHYITLPNDVNLFEYLDKNFCYTFELVSPDSRVVVPYKNTRIYLIGMRSVIDFEERDPDDFEISKFISRPKQYQIGSLSGCLDAVERMGYDEEGFVVVDRHWHRVKIKSPAYVIAHHLRNNKNINKEKILEILERGEKDEFIGYFPEYQKYFDEIEPLKNKFLESLTKAVIDIDLKIELNKTESIDNWTRKDFAKYILDNYGKISSFLFKYMDTNLLEYFIKKEWDALDIPKKLEIIYKEK